MKRIAVSFLVALAAPSGASAQGAIIETLDGLKQAAEPQVYRGVLPEKIDLSSKLPSVRAQSRTSTCVSWSATYVAASFALRKRGLDPDLRLSPAFTYNAVSGDRWCGRGTSISATLDYLRDVGALPLEQFAFDAGSCARKPTAAEIDLARQFRIRAWSAFDASSVDKVKEQLARGVPVIFATHTTPKLNQLRGDDVLQDDDIPGEGHSMAVVGYDNAKRAFLVQNSYGTGWGNKGYGWFGYDYWKRNVRVGFVIE
ncbi:C1 family peptidase [Bradyrhizobium diazoefficiens]|nr:C1 family peptidase [Bradyrhizobium diazoefficiens]MBR0778690.1 C1 family peptidase [Bradyrhizobium diazoefficiens]